MARRHSPEIASAVSREGEKLLSRMTLEEKSAQVCSVDIWAITEGRKFSPEKAAKCLAHGIGEISRVGGDTDFAPEEIAAVTAGLQEFLKEKTRLGIPALVHEECCSGYMARHSTMYPQAIGMAGTWNPALVGSITAAFRPLMRSVGVHQGLAPLLDVARDPRWGRMEETFGEDPYLVAQVGMAYVRGLQGGDLASGVIATGKHFVAYGIPDGGRNIHSSRVGPRELRDVYCFPFEAAVKAVGLGSIMNAYHEIDGIPCVADKGLLTDILRGEWGFEGIVVSDYGAIEMLRTWHLTAMERKEAAKMALEAGIDVELNTPECFAQPLVDAVKEGYIREEHLSDAVRRVLRMKSRLGLFKNAGPKGPKASVSMFDSRANRALALRAAEESITLLKNDNAVLPLKDVRRIAVIGPNADSYEAMLGDYAYAASMAYWRKAKVDYSALRVVTALEGIRSTAPKSCEIVFAKGCDTAGQSKDLFRQATMAAARADAVIAVMGEDSFVYGGEMRDRDELGLLGVQEELLKEVAGLGKPIILVVLSGRPHALGNVDKYCAAVLWAWCPGEEGGNAIARILFGKVNPSGKLPVSFPQSVGQITNYYSRKPARFGGYIGTGNKLDARYPFGHGLSYTTFAYSSLEITPGKVKAGGRVRIAATVENTGNVAGAEVVQLYIHDVVGSVVRPVKELKGFAKVKLAPGEKKRVAFELDTELLAFTGVDMKLIIEGGRYEVAVGSSSEDIRLKGEFDVAGNKIIPGRTVFTTPVRIVKVPARG